MRCRSILFACVILASAGCAVGPDYKRPELSLPAGYKSAGSQEDAPALSERWWELFQDTELNALEEKAASANTDLRAAVARFDQARAAAHVARSSLFPTILFDPSIERSRSAVRSGNVSTVPGTAPGTIVASRSRSGVESTQVRVPFDLDYELDVWGRVRRAYESADATAEAAANDAHVVLNTLQSDVAIDYFGLIYLAKQGRVLDETVHSYEEQLRLTEKQFNAGLVGRTDVVQADSLLKSTVTQQIEIQRQTEDLTHAMALLLGETPSDIEISIPAVPSPPPKIPAGLPGDLLRRRPDVASAEQQLIAANAEIGEAIANFLPQIRLTSSAGYQAFDVTHAIDWQQRVWSVGAGATLPIFEGGRLVAALEQARARYREELANYQGSVLTAIKEVEDTLTDMHYRSDEAEAQAAAAAASAEYYRLAVLQHEQGLTSYLQVIDAERTKLQSELSLAQIENERYAATILLIKALGGGWSGA